MHVSMAACVGLSGSLTLSPGPVDNPELSRRFFDAIPKALHVQMKFIDVLREPISRDLSAYNHMRGGHVRAKSRGHQFSWSYFACGLRQHLQYPNTYRSYAATFRSCWSGEGQGGRCDDCMRKVAERGQYHKHLQRWFRLFGREKFLILESSMLWEKSPPALVQDTLQRVVLFLGLAGNEWSRLVETGMTKSNSAETKYQGKETEFRIDNLGQSLCQEMANYYEKGNWELYTLMRRTKSKAPPKQSDFLEFADPCSGMKTEQ